MKSSSNNGTQSQDNGSGTNGSSAGGVRGRASSAYSATRERTSAAYGSVREKASGAFSSGRQQIETNPAIAVLGGLAVGAALGALLPRTEREKELLGEVGTKVTDAAREAANNAVEAGKQQVNEISHNAMAKVGEAVVGAVVSGDTAKAQ